MEDNVVHKKLEVLFTVLREMLKDQEDIPAEMIVFLQNALAKCSVAYLATCRHYQKTDNPTVSSTMGDISPEQFATIIGKQVGDSIRDNWALALADLQKREPV